MKCKRIRKLIMTDYLDGELKEPVRRQVEDHLKQCPECLEYKEKVLQSAVRPFENAGVSTPPHAIWERIEERLDAEALRPTAAGKSPDLLKTLGRSFRRVFLHPKPVLAAVMAVLIVVVAFGITRLPWQTSEKIVGTYLIEQVDFLNQLDADISESEDENGPLGTAIETFFM